MTYYRDPSGKVVSVAKSDCPHCHGMGYFKTDVEQPDGSLQETITECRCVDVTITTTLSED